MSAVQIPISHRIKEFKHHLQCHDRTILSAKYGDGKTYFLSKFVTYKDVAKKFVFITIYPVNYQVVSNKDIFDLIKRDIFYQMILQNMIEDDYSLDESQALSLFIQNNKLDITEQILSFLSLLDCPENVAQAVSSAMASMKLFKGLKTAFSKFKGKTYENKIAKFFDSDDSRYIYESDVITRIIKDNIKSYKEKHKKEVVLVIEDLDRLDPAHLFRIMNVFSAHIDYSYKYGVMPDNSLGGNKFDFDKVVFVMDYNNTKRIFAHFYGEDVNFIGYIEKFSDNGYFTYSLKKETEEYIWGAIEKETGLPQSIIKDYLDYDFIANCSLRKILSSVKNTKKQILPVTEILQGGKKIKVHLGILMLFVILRRLNFSNEDITDKTKVTFKHDTYTAFKYSAGVLSAANGNELIKCFYGQQYMKDNYYGVIINNISDLGLVEEIRYLGSTNSQQADTISNNISKLFDYIVV